MLPKKLRVFAPSRETRLHLNEKNSSREAAKKDENGKWHLPRQLFYLNSQLLCFILQPVNLLLQFRFSDGPSSQIDFSIGFRVASVPEPSCVVLTLLASGMFVTRRKRG